jgi:hypothetical protein
MIPLSDITHGRLRQTSLSPYSPLVRTDTVSREFRLQYQDIFHSLFFSQFIFINLIPGGLLTELISKTPLDTN